MTFFMFTRFVPVKYSFAFMQRQSKGTSATHYVILDFSNPKSLN